MYLTETGKQIVPEEPPENLPVVIQSPELAAAQSQSGSKTLEQIAAELEELKTRVNTPPQAATTVATVVETPAVPAKTVAEIKPITEEVTPQPQAVTTDAPPPSNPDAKPNPTVKSGNVLRKLFLG